MDTRNEENAITDVLSEEGHKAIHTSEYNYRTRTFIEKKKQPYASEYKRRYDHTFHHTKEGKHTFLYAEDDNNTILTTRESHIHYYTEDNYTTLCTEE